MGHVRKLSSDVMRLLRAGPRAATAKLPRREFTKRVLAGAASGLALVFLGKPAAAFARISASGAALQIGCDDLENCTPDDSACDFPGGGAEHCWCQGNTSQWMICCDYLCSSGKEVCCNNVPTFEECMGEPEMALT